MTKLHASFYGSVPFFRDIAHRQVHQSENSILTRKDSLRFNDLTQRTIDRLNRVGGVDDAANLLTPTETLRERIIENRNDVFPVANPDL